MNALLYLFLLISSLNATSGLGMKSEDEIRPFLISIRNKNINESLGDRNNILTIAKDNALLKEYDFLLGFAKKIGKNNENKLEAIITTYLRINSKLIEDCPFIESANEAEDGQGDAELVLLYFKQNQGNQPIVEKHKNTESIDPRKRIGLKKESSSKPDSKISSKISLDESEKPLLPIKRRTEETDMPLLAFKRRPDDGEATKIGVPKVEKVSRVSEDECVAALGRFIRVAYLRISKPYIISAHKNKKKQKNCIIF